MGKKATRGKVKKTEREKKYMGKRMGKKKETRMKIRKKGREKEGI